jgi:hypothetical protein
LVNRIQYDYRLGLGKTYQLRKNKILSIEQLSIAEKQKFVFTRMKIHVVFAYDNNKFHQKYHDNGIISFSLQIKEI